MDDGYNMLNRGCEICSQSFTIEDNEKFINFLYKKFNIKSHLVNVQGGYGKKIYIIKKDKYNFFNTIKPFIIESMKYKIRK